MPSWYVARFEQVYTSNDVTRAAIRPEVKVTVVRFDAPTGKGIKVASRKAKGVTLARARARAAQQIPIIMRMDQSRRRREIKGAIQRLKESKS